MKRLNRELRKLGCSSVLGRILSRVQMSKHFTGLVPQPKQWTHIYNAHDYEIVETKLPNGVIKRVAKPRIKNTEILGSDPNCW